MVLSEELENLALDLTSRLSKLSKNPSRKGGIPRPALIGPDFPGHQLDEYMMPSRGLPPGINSVDSLKDNHFIESFFGYVDSYFLTGSYTDHPFNYIQEVMEWTRLGRRPMFPRRVRSTPKGTEVLEGLATFLWATGAPLTVEKNRIIAHFEAGDIGVENNHVVFTDSELDAAFIPGFDWHKFMTNSRITSPAVQPELFEIWIAACIQGDPGTIRAAQVLAYLVEEKDPTIPAAYYVGESFKTLKSKIKAVLDNKTFLSDIRDMLPQGLFKKSEFNIRFKKELIIQEFLTAEERLRTLEIVSEFVKFDLTP